MNRKLCILCLALASVPAAASAEGEWKRVRQKQGEYLFTMSSVGPTESFVAGMFMDSSARFPIPQPVVYWTQDGGKMLKTVMGNLPASMMSGLPQEIHFRDSMTGWISIGKKLYRTTNRGAAWFDSEAGVEVNDIHFLTDTIGVAVGKGGSILRSIDGGGTWLPVTSGTVADLHCQFWLDDQHAFAAGHRIVEDEDELGNVTTTYHEGIILITKDGGQTWSKGFETQGTALCPVFFLPDGHTGWLAVTEPGQGDELRTKARLYRTQDGGSSFADMDLDTSVGQLNFMMTVPLDASYFTAIRWDDEFRGHLAGSVFVVEISSGGGGGGGKVYRTVDFMTMDGGKTWEKTDLGQITVNITGGSMPESDGQSLDGDMPSLFEGTMVGENGSVWVYEYHCTSHVDCGTGYACNADSLCEPLPAPPDPCADGGCGPDDNQAVQDIGEAAQPAGGDGSACATGQCGGEPGGDCAMTGGPSGTPWDPAASLLLFALVTAALRSRRRIAGPGDYC